MNDISKIWYILNEAVSGRYPVYNLACCMAGLPKDVIYDMANKLYNDTHTKKKISQPTDADFYAVYKARIKQAKINKIIESL